MFTKLQAILVGILTLIGIVFAAFFKGRSNGRAEVREEVQEQHTKDVETVAKERVENVKVVKDVQQKVVKSSDSDIDKRLSDEWTRG